MDDDDLYQRAELQSGFPAIHDVGIHVPEQWAYIREDGQQ